VTRQKGKGKKRRKSWHRGHGEAQRWNAVERQLPDVGSGAHPADATPPEVANRRPGKRHRGESL
jgi:hypothetical protein